MAQLYPPYQTILNLRQRPTEGELAMLDCLLANLDDSYEIYFQPMINGDMPDIIIMKEGHGAYIIEVKDWVLNHYHLNNVQDWFYYNNRIQSPFHQVNRYKKNLFNLHIEGLGEKKILNSNHWRIIKCAVYFHKERTHSVEAFIKPGYPPKEAGPDALNRYGRYVGFLNHFDYLGYDDLNSRYVAGLKKRFPFRNPDPLFDDDTYQSLRRYLRPPLHRQEEGKNIIYSQEQQRIIKSAPNLKQKIRGVAGSGKTLCLAKRAVNAVKRNNGPILILTFNITLRNYIHDKISEVREEFEWKNFTILHYHAWIWATQNNEGSVDSDIRHDESSSALSNRTTYKTILVDEVQDYKKDWISNIRMYLDPVDGELVMYGDEKQNIYEREMDSKEKKPYTGIPGQWNLLKSSYRVSNSIAKLAELYQKSFFEDKYEYDEILIQRDLFQKSHLDFYSVDKFSVEEIWGLIRSTMTKYGIHDNDLCIQASKVEPLRTLESFIRTKHAIKATSMFESQEVYEKLCKKNDDGTIGKPDPKKLEAIRRSKKFHFWNNPGIIKFCTIHSYKGWETDTLVLLIGEELSDADDPDREEYVSDELIYTAITRCRNNLIVVEVGGNKYESFFKRNMALVN